MIETGNVWAGDAQGWASATAKNGKEQTMYSACGNGFQLHKKAQ